MLENYKITATLTKDQIVNLITKQIEADNLNVKVMSITFDGSTKYDFRGNPCGYDFKNCTIELTKQKEYTNE